MIALYIWELKTTNPTKLKRQRAELPAVRTTLDFYIQYIIICRCGFVCGTHNIICILWSVGGGTCSRRRMNPICKQKTHNPWHANTRETVRRWRNTCAHASSSLRHTPHVPNVKFRICLWISWYSHVEPLPSVLSSDFPGVVYYYFLFFYPLLFLFRADPRNSLSRP